MENRGDSLTSIEELWHWIDTVRPLSPVRMPLLSAHGAVLAEEIVADSDQPPFDRSAMDGFVVRAGDSRDLYVLAGEILPGSPAPSAPEPGRAYRIYTGAMVPDGCAVAPIEEADIQADALRLRGPASTKWIRRRGSVAKQGDPLVSPRTRLAAEHLGVLASVGADQPLVIPPARVLHLTTGREIVPVSAQPGIGQIRNSNASLIAGLVAEYGGYCCRHIHVDESVDSAVEAVEQYGRDNFDLLLISGGASVGTYDGTPAVLERLGFQLRVRKINSRPGKPMIFATRGSHLAFGLPGNPLSHYVTFHLAVRRALARLAGAPPPKLTSACFEPGCTIGKDKRETFWPADLRLAGGRLVARPLDWRDSGDVAVLNQTKALLYVPAGDELPAPDAPVQVLVTRPISG